MCGAEETRKAPRPQPLEASVLRSAWGAGGPASSSLPLRHCNRGVNNMTGSLEAIRYEHSASGRAELQVRPLCAWSTPQLHLAVQ